MKEALSQNEIEFVYLDISENMLNLKKFLKIRDKSKVFYAMRNGGGVGVPCVVVNDGEQVFIGLPDDLSVLKD